MQNILLYRNDDQCHWCITIHYTFKFTIWSLNIRSSTTLIRRNVSFSRSGNQRLLYYIENRSLDKLRSISYLGIDLTFEFWNSLHIFSLNIYIIIRSLFKFIMMHLFSFSYFHIINSIIWRSILTKTEV